MPPYAAIIMITTTTPPPPPTFLLTIVYTLNVSKVVALPKPSLKQSETALKQHQLKYPWSALLLGQACSVSLLTSCLAALGEFKDIC